MNQVNDTIFSFALHWGFQSYICNPRPAIRGWNLCSPHSSLILFLSFPPSAEFSQNYLFYPFSSSVFLQVTSNLFEKKGQT